MDQRNAKIATGSSVSKDIIPAVFQTPLLMPAHCRGVRRVKVAYEAGSLCKLGVLAGELGVLTGQVGGLTDELGGIAGELGVF